MMQQNTHGAPVRSYGKGQLARMYYPDEPEFRARRMFRDDLDANPRLCAALRQRGWTPTKRRLRKDWVRLIFQVLEPP